MSRIAEALSSETEIIKKDILDSIEYAFYKDKTLVENQFIESSKLYSLYLKLSEKHKNLQMSFFFKVVSPKVSISLKDLKMRHSVNRKLLALSFSHGFGKTIPNIFLKQLYSLGYLKMYQILTSSKKNWYLDNDQYFYIKIGNYFYKAHETNNDQFYGTNNTVGFFISPTINKLKIENEESILKKQLSYIKNKEAEYVEKLKNLRIEKQIVEQKLSLIEDEEIITDIPSVILSRVRRRSHTQNA